MMKAQFFIISSVIIIYVIVLTFQYLSAFSDIRLTQVEEQGELSYIKNIKDSFIQTFNTSNNSNNGDFNRMLKDISFESDFHKQELIKNGIDFESNFLFFSNGFETDDLTKWSDKSVIPPTIVNDTSYDGSYSLYCNGTEYVKRQLPGVGEVYARAYVDFKDLPSNGYKYYFMEFYNNTGNDVLDLGLWNNSGVYELSTCFNGNCWGSNAVVINGNEWHYFELYWLENGTNSKIRAWYDGYLEVDNETVNSGGVGKSIDEYRFGGVKTVGVGSSDLYVDCIAIGTDYIGKDCYPDEQNYFVFYLKTKELETQTGFASGGEYQVPPIPNWLSGWQHRKQYNIASSTGADVNYTIKIIVINGTGTDSGNTVYINNEMRNDFGDIRFTDSTGNLLNYWMESVNNGANATFWVKIPGNLTLANYAMYLYYGNPSAINISSGTSTFLFFDDFNSGTIDWTKWQSSNPGHVLYSESNGKLVCANVGTTTDLLDSASTYGGGISFESLVRVDNTNGQGVQFLNSNLGQYTDGIWSDLNWYGGTLVVYFDSSGPWTHDYSYSYTADTTDYFRVVQKIPSSGSATAEFWLGNNIIWSQSDTPPYTSGYVGFFAFNAGNLYVDWTFVRKYVSSEPTGTWGPEEP